MSLTYKITFKTEKNQKENGNRQIRVKNLGVTSRILGTVSIPDPYINTILTFRTSRIPFDNIKSSNKVIVPIHLGYSLDAENKLTRETISHSVLTVTDENQVSL